MLTVRVNGDVELRLRRAAASADTTPEAIAERVLDEHLEPATDAAGDQQATLDFFAELRAEEERASPAELERWRAENEEFMMNLDRNRRESEGPNYRPIWPMGQG